jgi:hypothetical protein
LRREAESGRRSAHILDAQALRAGFKVRRIDGKLIPCTAGAPIPKLAPRGCFEIKIEIRLCLGAEKPSTYALSLEDVLHLVKRRRSIAGIISPSALLLTQNF